MRPRRVVQPHVHALFGLYQVSTDEIITDRRRNPVSTASYTDNSAAFVLGAGVNIMPNHRIGFRAGLDMQIHPGALPTGRFTAGVVVPIGRR